MSVQAPKFRAFERIEQARMPSTRGLFTYWHANLRDSLPPRRTDIDPAAIKSLLPFILLGDIEPDPFRVRFRLIGTAIAEFSRQDFSGRYLDELDYGSRDSIEWLDCYRYIHAHHVGVIGVNELSLSDGHHTSYEFALMPLLRDDDPAGSFIAVEAYDNLDHLHIPDFNPVTRLS
jgi:hypothetical protein